jgi:glycerol-1-phosphate dehydrogenase [NAD(P)+]
MESNTLLFPVNRDFTGKCGVVHSVWFKKIHIGHGALWELPVIINEFYVGRKVLLVGDIVTKQLFVDKISKLFSPPPEAFVIGGPSLEEVNRLAETLARDTVPVAVGGGSVIDVVKLASYMRGVPFVSVPTSPSHDGIISSTASITVKGKKTSFKAKPPETAVLDLTALSSAPKRMISAGYGDVLVKYTSLKDWELSHMDTGEYFCQDSFEISLKTLDKISSDLRVHGVDVVDLVYALVNSGGSMVIAGSSRPESGSEHIVSHYLDNHAARPAMHGEQVALLTLLLSFYHSVLNPYWWNEKDKSPEEIFRVLRLAGLPQWFQQLGISDTEVLEALVNAVKERPDKYTILHKYPMDARTAQELIVKTSSLAH